MRPAAALLPLLALAACAGQQPPPRGGRHGGGSGVRPEGLREGTFISPVGEPFRGPGGREANARRWFDGADADHDGRLTAMEMQADAARFFATLDIDHDGEIGPDEIERYEREVAPEIRVGGAGGSFGGSRPGGGQGGGRHGGGGRGGMGGGGMGGGGMGGGHGGMGGGNGGMRGSGGQDGASPGEPALQGAARFGYLDQPEPVTSADADFNRGVSRAEFLAAAQRRFLLLDAGKAGTLSFDALPRLR